jgi:hypothetical protein
MVSFIRYSFYDIEYNGRNPYTKNRDFVSVIRWMTNI